MEICIANKDHSSVLQHFYGGTKYGSIHVTSLRSKGLGKGKEMYLQYKAIKAFTINDHNITKLWFSVRQLMNK